MPALYDTIGRQYGLTRRADPALCDTLWRLLALRSDAQVLDLACGSGHYSSALAARGGRWVGLDTSAVMLERARDLARERASDRSPSILWTQGDAAALPYHSESFDAVLCTLAIHHFGPLDSPFAEVRRVLAPGGRFVLFTAFAEQMAHYWLARYFPTMMARSIEGMPTQESTLCGLRRACFDAVSWQPYDVAADLSDLFLYSGKHRPEIYLDAAVRANISSFARLCADAELASGLAALRADIDGGRPPDAPAHRHEPLGDYAFVTAVRT